MKKYKNKGFSLIELLAVIVILGILATLASAVFSRYFSKAYNSKVESTVRNVGVIIKATVYTFQSGANFADLDEDTVFGPADEVSISDVQDILRRQDFAIPEFKDQTCILYGYNPQKIDSFLVVTEKADSPSGVGSDRFVFEGNQDAMDQVSSLATITCTAGSEGVTGGNWDDYVWLNLKP